MLQPDPHPLSDSKVDAAFGKPGRLDWVEPAKAIGIILVIAYHSTVGAFIPSGLATSLPCTRVTSVVMSE